MAETTFAELGRIDAIRALYEGTPFKPFGKASIKPSAGASVVSASRMLLEGIDFDLVYFPLKHLGYKGVVAVTGELYASLADPRVLEVQLGISAKLDFPQVRQLWEGVVAAAKEHGYRQVLLDLAPSRNGLAFSVSAAGTVPAGVSKGKGTAATKDLLCVSGRLGAAYLGQQLLERERVKFERESGDSGRNAGAEKSEAGAPDVLGRNRMIVGAYLKPELPLNLSARFQEAGIIPSGGVLVTRGLADAVLRLGRDSGLGVKVYADMIPFEGNSFALGKELDIDPMSAAMNGGDDFQLLFTVPILKAEAFRRDFQDFAIIGHLALPEAGTSLVLPSGAELPVTAQGWK